MAHPTFAECAEVGWTESSNVRTGAIDRAQLFLRLIHTKQELEVNADKNDVGNLHSK